MPEGGSIDVSAVNITVGPGDNLPLPNGAYVKITISDQSIGILNEHLQQLFDPYFTSRQRGSGIGLATTYTIIKNHGGLITVESEFGSGTTFHIFLPACGNKR
jgi:signal transduction histidine kinase